MRDLRTEFNDYMTIRRLELKTKEAYTNVLKWDETKFSIPPQPRSKKILMVLSVEEVNRLLNSVANLKHRTLLLCIYSSGLRVSEAVNLKYYHIESDPSRMMIRVEQGKGRKDRYTILSEKFLTELRDYWRKFQPREFIFFGQDRYKPMPVSTAQQIYYNAKKKAGITKGRGIHTLRHCFASHLLWQGTDIYTIKKFFGHSSIKTTFKYLHVTREQLAKIKSPLDTMFETKEDQACRQKNIPQNYCMNQKIPNTSFRIFFVFMVTTTCKIIQRHFSRKKSWATSSLAVPHYKAGILRSVMSADGKEMHITPAGTVIVQNVKL